MSTTGVVKVIFQLPADTCDTTHTRTHQHTHNKPGRTLHVGGDTRYLTLYCKDNLSAANTSSYKTTHGVNLIGIVAADPDALEAQVISL